MRRIHLLTFLLAALVTVPLFAVGRTSRTNVVDDVIRMQKSGVAEDEIIAFIHKGNARFDVSADDLIALHDAGISRNVIKAVLDEADARGERRDGDRRDGDYAYRDGRDTVVYSPRFVAVGGWPYYYDPYYYYPGYYYDPYWYGPRISLGFNFGFGRYYGYHGGYRGPVHGGHGGGRHH